MHRFIGWVALAGLALLSTPAAGQTAVGLRAGLQSSGLSTSQATSQISETVYGGYLGIGLTDRLALQFEIIYGRRGASGLGLGTDALDPTATDVKVDMGYLEVPVLLRAGFPGEWLLPSFFVGPYLGILLSCEVTPAASATTDCGDETATQRFDPRGTDFGVTAGAALDVALGGSTVFIDARYSLGLFSIQSGGGAFDARHNGVAITGGLAIPLGR